MENVFKLKFIEPNKTELEKIGFDKSYLTKGAEKHQFCSIKIYGLSSAQANILKQTALIEGTDCAVHRETITGKIEISDCILSGSLSQLSKIAQRLKKQPFKLSVLAEQILNLHQIKSPLKIREKEFQWGKRTYIMGIVNVTPDSFSDGGQFTTLEKALEHSLKLINDGADIIDIGGESTRPYSNCITAEEEIQRVIPLIKALRAENNDIVISIDTRNSRTAREALIAGADIINDVSACDWDNRMIEIAKEFNCPIVLNHSKGTPDIMQENTDYNDIADDIWNYFYEKIKTLTEKGIDRNKIIIDPGIGFGKNTEQNFELIKRTAEFKSLGSPILVGHSRKTFLQKTLETNDIKILDEATNILTGFLIRDKIDIVRVHDVKSACLSVGLSLELGY